jgi:hypothetical protein
MPDDATYALALCKTETKGAQCVYMPFQVPNRYLDGSYDAPEGVQTLHETNASPLLSIIMAELLDTAPSRLATEMGFALMRVAKVSSLQNACGETRICRVGEPSGMQTA